MYCMEKKKSVNFYFNLTFNNKETVYWSISIELDAVTEEQQETTKKLEEVTEELGEIKNLMKDLKEGKVWYIYDHGNHLHNSLKEDQRGSSSWC